MTRDLVLSGFAPEDARRISRVLALDEKICTAVVDAPPHDVTAEEVAAIADKPGVGRGGWDETVAERLGVSADHVLRWTAWRKRSRPAAIFGRRTRRFYTIADERNCVARMAARAASAEAASIYVASLPPDIRRLQATARATCIRVSADGRSVTEALHDVGGSMTSIVGRNGYTLPDSLGGQQAQHDSVYHKA